MMEDENGACMILRYSLSGYSHGELDYTPPASPNPYGSIIRKNRIKKGYPHGAARRKGFNKVSSGIMKDFRQVQY